MEPVAILAHNLALKGLTWTGTFLTAAEYLGVLQAQLVEISKFFQGGASR